MSYLIKCFNGREFQTEVIKGGCRDRFKCHLFRRAVQLSRYEATVVTEGQAGVLVGGDLGRGEGRGGQREAKVVLDR